MYLNLFQFALIADERKDLLRALKVEQLQFCETEAECQCSPDARPVLISFC